MDDGGGDVHRFGAAVDGAGRAQPAAHLLVADAGFFKHIALGQEALAGIERPGRQLGVQMQFGQAEPAPGLDQGQQQGLTHPMAAMAGQHRHATDTAVRCQPAAHRVPARRQCPVPARTRAGARRGSQRGRRRG
ncbi:hypothetical protein G6F35_012616 [Rhizopus arrhizus]|nr:hypothetical protein G6F35_012616 [Rhizopus arrhizus]